jgi:glycosyltransferase involved in cell wall biosynthesis
MKYALATSEFKNQLKDIKICRISTVPFFMVSQLKGQVEYLRDIGMNVVLISSDGPEMAMIKAGQRMSVKIINIPRALSPWQDFVALIRMAHFFLTENFDIVHSTTPKAGLLTAIAAFISGIPIRLHTFTGQPWVALKGFMRWSSRFADKLIGILNTKCYADSISQARFMVKEGIISSKKIDVIGQGSLAGVDMARFNSELWSSSTKQQLRQSLSIASSSKILIFVGRISQDKGITELILAFCELLNMNYDVDLLLVGPHDQDCGGVSSLDLKETGQCSRIHHIGYTDCPEKYLAISNIFCLPSYREGFGTVVIEAAAMGLPTVGTSIYGLTDAVVDGETGILVPPRDDRTLLKALKHLLDHPYELKKMGKAARERCFKLFDSNEFNEKLAEEYLKILNIKN